MKQLFKNLLGISSLEMENKILNERLTKAMDMIVEQHDNREQLAGDLYNRIDDLEYKVDEKSDEYRVDDLEYQLSNLESTIEEAPTRDDLQEMLHEELAESIEQVVNDKITEAEQRNFDYDLVVSQVVSIIVEKLNR
jgi:hypothetical protein